MWVEPRSCEPTRPSSTRSIVLKTTQKEFQHDATSELAGGRITVQRPGPVHGLHSFLLDPLQQFVASGDIMNQPNDLAGSPNLEMTLDRVEEELR